MAKGEGSTLRSSGPSPYNQMRKLRPYQKDMKRYLFQNPKGAFLHVEMRLGKTLVVIRRLADINRYRKILVIAPITTLQVWTDELLMEKESSSCMIVGKREDRLDLLGKYRWSLLNNEGVRVVWPELKEMEWDAIVIDESVGIKNPNAKVTKLLLLLPRKNERRIAMSGLPNPEGYENFVTQFIWTFGSFMGCDNFWKWRIRNMRPGAFGYDLKPGVRKKIKEEVRSLAFFLTRKDVGMDSEKVYSPRYLEMTPYQEKVYRGVEDDFVLKLKGTRPKETKWVLEQRMMLSRVAGGFYEGKELSGRKIGEIKSLLNGELRKESVVIWFRFNDQLKATKKALQAIGIKSKGISGTTKATSRAHYVKLFKERRIRVLCVQVKIGKFALNLAQASTAIYYSTPYSLNERLQSEDRIVQIGKPGSLLYIDLVTKGTIDEDVALILREKKFEAKYVNNRLLELMEKRRLRRKYV